MKKRMGWIGGVLLLWSVVAGMMSFYGYAASGQAMIETVFQEEEQELTVVCSLPGEAENGDCLEVMLGGTPLPVVSVSTADQEDIPRTVYCLVDVSGSMKERIEKVKAVLNVIGEGLGERDRLVIGKLGNRTVNTGFLTTREEMAAEIERLTCTDEDTDLYGGIVQALKFLQQEPEVAPLRYLVILSDGCDRQDDGVTWNEAYDAVGRADIPVYTVAPVLSSADYEKAKELGSFSRNAVGGIHFPRSDAGASVPVEMTEDEIGTEILQAMGQTVLIRADLSEQSEPAGDSYLLSVTFHAADGKTYEDSHTLRSGQLSFGTASVKQEEEQEPELILSTGQPETETQAETEPEEKEKTILTGVIAGGLLLAAGAVVLLMTGHSKKKQQEKAASLAEQKCQDREEALCIERERRERDAVVEQSLQKEKRRKEMEAYRKLPRLAVRMTALGVKNKVYTIELVQGHEMTIGRNQKAMIILDPEDKRLSGIQCAMIWDGAGVYVQDRQSTNGTSVNGVVVDHLGQVAVVPGDILRIGSCEYRLHWEV